MKSSKNSSSDSEFKIIVCNRLRGRQSQAAEFEVNEAGGLGSDSMALRSHGAEGMQISPARLCAEGPARDAGRKRHQIQTGQRLRSRVPCLLQVRQAAARRRQQSNPDHPVRSPTKRALPAGRGCLGLPNPGIDRRGRIGGPAGCHQVRHCRRPFPRGGVCRAAIERDGRVAPPSHLFRFNYGELDDCTMLLDIGAKTSNLLFFEKGKVFSRSINLGANSITQDFAHESKLKWDAAEKLKIDEGFVSLGGAYEEPENPHQAAISKIARQFMTRLHIQVNQTMQFYRGQQGGSAPQRLYLSGGASIMPYTAQFFAEKRMAGRVFQPAPECSDRPVDQPGGVGQGRAFVGRSGWFGPAQPGALPD